eukprot:TRINITY_DN5910_c0_g1_i1.p2 TRINITY_DN5910_c0_g1~~TRINITY_DN5910_c0_g1_i1.p2  ORF type:complete len:252 (-),score=60.22 TRINITY_DN5910_c0_g1_i1:1382-2137(-)
MLEEDSPPQAHESTQEEAATMGAAVGSPAKSTTVSPRPVAVHQEEVGATVCPPAKSTLVAPRPVSARDEEKRADVGEPAKCTTVAPPPVIVHDEEESQELLRVFRTVDVDNDGSISRVELANFIKKLECSNLTEKQIDAILQTYDENGSGSLEYDEFLKLYESLIEEDDVAHDEELLRDVFNVFDANKDGLISPEELHLIVHNLNLGKGKKVFDFSQMIKAVDIDGDGFVDIKEFARLMKRDLFLDEEPKA